VPGQPLETVELSRMIEEARPLAPDVIEIPTAPDFADESERSQSPAALSRTPLFSALGISELRWLIEQVRLVRKADGEVVFSQGEPGRRSSSRSRARWWPT
jgi:hypothetical protein